MLKSQLARMLVDRNPHLYQQDADHIVNIVLDEITAALRDGGRAELGGFGAFSVKSREARQGRNPRTGAFVDVTPKRVLAFRCSKNLHKRLNNPEAIAQEEAGAYQPVAGAAIVMAPDNE